MNVCTEYGVRMEYLLHPLTTVGPAVLFEKGAVQRLKWVVPNCTSCSPPLPLLCLSLHYALVSWPHGHPLQSALVNVVSGAFLGKSWSLERAGR